MNKIYLKGCLTYSGSVREFPGVTNFIDDSVIPALTGRDFFMYDPAYTAVNDAFR